MIVTKKYQVFLWKNFTDLFQQKIETHINEIEQKAAQEIAKTIKLLVDEFLNVTSYKFKFFKQYKILQNKSLIKYRIK